MATGKNIEERGTSDSLGYDPVTGLSAVIAEEHKLIHEGRVFFISGVEFDVPDNSSRFWVFRIGDVPAHFKRVTIGASKGPVELQLFEAPTLTDEGTVYNQVVNLNRTSPRTPLTEIRRNVVASVNGNDLIGTLYIPQDGGQGVTGASGALEEFILAPNTDYLFVLTNDPAGSGTVDMYISLVFYELGD